MCCVVVIVLVLLGMLLTHRILSVLMMADATVVSEHKPAVVFILAAMVFKLVLSDVFVSFYNM